jgi:hypothetical protein
MANTFSAVGFQQYAGTGSSPTYEQVVAIVASTNTTPIFFGDPVVQSTGTTGLGTGYITQASSGPQSLTISGFTLSNGLVTATFTTTTAPQVGATLVLSGMTTATTLNGTWTILSATTTTAVFAYSGAALNTQATTGYVFAPVAGVFVGCRYLSTAQKRVTWSRYWPGSDANGDVEAYIVNDPNARFIVQTGNSNTTTTALTLATIGQNIGFNYVLNGASPATVNGNTSSGNSTYFADQYSLAANGPGGYTGQPFLPFRIVGLANAPLGVTGALASINGNDPTTAYNSVIVAFNNAVSRQLSSL